jgi:hypothetical protein
MTITKKKKPANPYNKSSLVQARVTTEEHQIIFTKAQMFSKGVIADFAREAMLNYKPIKKVSK